MPKTYIHKATEKRGRLVIASSNQRELASRIIAAVLDGETRPAAIAAMIEANATDVCGNTKPRQTQEDSEDLVAYTNARQHEALADEQARRNSGRGD